MRLGLSERVAIEAGIYRRDSLTKIAKDTGISRKSLSKEIRQNRTLAPAAKFNGKDCRFAAECTRQCVCGDFLCRQECVFCRKIDCRTLCPAYSPLSCMRIQSPPYVCNVCQLRRGCVYDRAYLKKHPGTIMLRWIPFSERREKVKECLQRCTKGT